MIELIDASSWIKRVTVFRSSALVTRSAEIATAGWTGRMDVRIGDLPLLLQENSVRVSFTDSAVAQLADMHLEMRPGSREGAMDTKNEERLRELLHDMLAAEVERKREMDRIRLLESLGPADYKTSDLPDAVAFAERHQVGTWLKLSDYVQKESVAARKRVRVLEGRLEDLRDEIAAARNRVERQSLAE